MSDSKALRIAGLSALAFVTLLVVGDFVLQPSGMPDVKDPATQWAQWAGHHHRRLHVAGYVGGFAVIALLLFAASLVSVLRRADATATEAWSRLGLAGAVAAGTIAIVGGVLQTVLYSRALLTPETDLATVRLLVDGSAVAFTLIDYPVAVMLAGFGISILRTDVVPRWMGGAGLVVAAGALVGASATNLRGDFSQDGGFGTVDLIAFSGLLAWILVIGIALLARSRRPT